MPKSLSIPLTLARISSKVEAVERPSLEALLAVKPYKSMKKILHLERFLTVETIKKVLTAATPTTRAEAGKVLEAILLNIF